MRRWRSRCWVTVAVSSSASASSVAAFTVTVFGVFQSVEENVRLAGSAVTSVLDGSLMVTVTCRRQRHPSVRNRVIVLSAAVTATVCATSQLSTVKVRLVLFSVRSVPAGRVTPTVTSPGGR